MTPTLFLTTLLALSQAQPAPPAEASTRVEATARADSAVLALIQEADVPAPSPGILMDIAVKHGNTVQTGAKIAQIDDREARGKLRLAQHELAAAEEEANNDVRVRAAQAAQRVAEAELAQAREIRARQPQAISETELRRLQLSAERYGLEVEVAQKDLAIARITQQAKAAAVELAQLELDKLQVASPLDGRVEHVYKHLGEWVQAGDPIARVIRMDRLRVEGAFDAKRYSPHELMGRPVTIEVDLPNNRVVRVEGEVSHVSSEVDAADLFNVWAEVDNREESGFWLLRPGLRARMTVYLR